MIAINPIRVKDELTRSGSRAFAVSSLQTLCHMNLSASTPNPTCETRYYFNLIWESNKTADTGP